MPTSYGKIQKGFDIFKSRIEANTRRRTWTNIKSMSPKRLLFLIVFLLVSDSKNSLCYAHTAGCFLPSLLVDRAFRARLGRIGCLSVLGPARHQLELSWDSLGTLCDALGRLLGALGELLGGSWELLEGSWGILGSCTR